MAKRPSEREVPCPCCGAVLTIDLNLGRVIAARLRRIRIVPNSIRRRAFWPSRPQSAMRCSRSLSRTRRTRATRCRSGLEEALREAKKEPVSKPLRGFESRLMPDESRRTRQVRVATYNIHRARGLDGRTRLNASPASWRPSTPTSSRSRKSSARARSSPGRPPNLVPRSAWAGSWRRRVTCAQRYSETWCSAVSRCAIMSSTT